MFLTGWYLICLTFGVSTVGAGRIASFFQLADVRAGRDSSDPQSLTRVGEMVFFTADDGVNGRELYVSRNASKGVLLIDIAAGGASRSAFAFCCSTRLLYTLTLGPLPLLVILLFSLLSTTTR